jgi:hypothetical protein
MAKKPQCSKKSRRLASCQCSFRGHFGRIIRLKDGQPVALADEPGRRLVMVMGPSGLESVHTQDSYEMLITIGYREDYIARKLEEGYKYYLIVFRRPEQKMVTANWKNSLAMVAREYPEVRDLIIKHDKELRSTPYAVFEKRAGFKFEEVDRLGPSDPRFMSLERLLASAGTATDVRRFLYHAVRFSDLYSGNGKTLTIDGKHGVREYIMANRPVSELGEYTLQALNVALPHASKSA